MQVADIAGWIAPAATMIAAMMTAANLGTRVTGWGFVVFTIGSVAWSLVGIGTGQSNLLFANAFLTVVNLVGIWRWLGRQARYDRGGETAERRSAAGDAQSKFAISRIVGAKVTDDDGERIGQVVDAMMGRDDHALAYLVVSCGGVGGLGETLHTVEPARLRFDGDGVTFVGDLAGLRALPALESDDWPGRVERADG